LLAFGTPLPDGSLLVDGLAGFLVVVFFLLFLALAVVVCEDCGCDDGFSPRLVEVGLGVVEDLVVDVVVEELLDDELEPEPDPEPELEVEGEVVVELDVEVGDELVVVLVALAEGTGVVLVAGVQESVSDAIPVSVTGSGICDTGVPGATLSTVNV
jgi:hypothetical protein